jgi:hypothetical protein
MPLIAHDRPHRGRANRERSMTIATWVSVGVLLTLAVTTSSSRAACIAQPIDRSEQATDMRNRSIAEFERSGVLYRVARTSPDSVQVQVSARFLELPFDTKQVLAWAVFSTHFDGEDEKQTVVFVDSRTLASVGRFDPCRGLRLE